MAVNGDNRVFSEPHCKHWGPHCQHSGQSRLSGSAKQRGRLVEPRGLRQDGPVVILSTSPPTGTRGDVIGREPTASQVNDGHSPSITVIAGHGRSNPGEVVGGTL